MDRSRSAKSFWRSDTLGRAVQVLQWVGGDAARSALKAWAGGAAGARLTEEAKRALALSTDAADAGAPAQLAKRSANVVRESVRFAIAELVAEVPLYQPLDPERVRGLHQIMVEAGFSSHFLRVGAAVGGHCDQ